MIVESLSTLTNLASLRKIELADYEMLVIMVNAYCILDEQQKRLANLDRIINGIFCVSDRIYD